LNEPPITVADWKKKLTAALGDIAAVGELTVESSLEVGLVGVRDALVPTIGRVEFTLAIPKRIQDELNPLSLPFPDAGERFRIITLLEFHGPATFVFCEDSIEDARAGTSAVFYVREFLQRELARSSHSARLVSIGPSPFHADLKVVWDSSPSQDITSSEPPLDPEKPPVRGYIDPRTNKRPWGTEIEIVCRPRVATDPFEMVTEIVLTALAKELSLFYQLVRDTDERRELANELAERAGDLVGLHRTEGLKGALTRLFKTAPAARDLMLDAITAETMQREHEMQGREAINDLYSSIYGWKLFANDLDSQLKEDFSPLVDAARKTGELLEGSRKKEYEIMILSASTLLGAAAGAIAALIAG
jgi:hypothetical protein